MLSEIETLLILQDRDQRILKHLNEIKRIPADIKKAEARLANDLAAVNDAKSAIQENNLAIKAIELDIGVRKDTLEKLKVQQYETKKNDEFTALENEITRYKEDVDQLETQELNLMEKNDELLQKLEQCQSALKLTQDLVDEEINNLKQRAESSKEQLRELRTKRNAIIKTIDEDLLSLYERLFKSKGSDAIVSAEKGQCGGCHMKLIPATIVKIQAEKEVTQCENCGRILYL